MRSLPLSRRSLPAGVLTVISCGLLAATPAAGQFGTVPGVGPTTPSLPRASSFSAPLSFSPRASSFSAPHSLPRFSASTSPSRATFWNNRNSNDYSARMRSQSRLSRDLSQRYRRSAPTYRPPAVRNSRPTRVAASSPRNSRSSTGLFGRSGRRRRR